MDESVKCECGNEHFWYFWDYARCTKCYNEYKLYKGFTGILKEEKWMRRFNNETHNYSNWEHTK